MLLWPLKALYQSHLKRPDREHDIHKQVIEQAVAKDATIEKLRGLLHRGWRRENHYAAGCEMLLIAMPEELTSEQRMLVSRARELFETAVLHGGGEGGGG